MTHEEYRNALENAIYLTACAVNGEKPDRDRVDVMAIDPLYHAAQQHLLTSIVAYALKSAGVENEAFRQAQAKAMRKNALFDADRSALCKELEAAGIWYMPLKGSVLKDLYPRYGMRQMADNDILFDPDRAEDVKVIMESLGFTAEHFGAGNHDCYQKPPVSNFELHRSLFSTAHEDKLYWYYKDVKDRLVKDEGNLFGWHFTDEDFYVYMVAHEYKHYSGGGTGLRSLLDTYVYLKQKTALDSSYIEEESQRLGLAAFERENRTLALHLFDGEPLSQQEQQMLDYILFAGTYGTMENRVRNQVNKLGRLGYLWSRAFLPLKTMKTLYLVLERAPVLLPVCWVIRWGKALLFNRKIAAFQLRAALGLKK